MCLRRPNVDRLTTPQLTPLALELRFRDPRTGETLMSYQELEQAREQAEAERALAEQVREQAVPRLLAMGLTPEQVAEALDLSIEDVQSAMQN